MVPPVAGEEQKNVPDAKRFSVDRPRDLLASIKWHTT